MRWSVVTISFTHWHPIRRSSLRCLYLRWSFWSIEREAAILLFHAIAMDKIISKLKNKIWIWLKLGPIPKGRLWKLNLLIQIAMKYLIELSIMVAFARVKAKSIFSKLRFKEIFAKGLETQSNKINKNLSIQKEKNSNYFFEAIKSGGMWLS